MELAREQNQLTKLSHANLHCGLNYFITLYLAKRARKLENVFNQDKLWCLKFTKFMLIQNNFLVQC